MYCFLMCTCTQIVHINMFTKMISWYQWMSCCGETKRHAFHCYAEEQRIIHTSKLRKQKMLWLGDYSVSCLCRYLIKRLPFFAVNKLAAMVLKHTWLHHFCHHEQLAVVMIEFLSHAMNYNYLRSVAGICVQSACGNHTSRDLLQWRKQLLSLQR